MSFSAFEAHVPISKSFLPKGLMFTQQFFSAFKAHVHISKSFQPLRLMFTQQVFSAFKAHVHISKSFQPVSLVWVFLFLDHFSLVWLILKLFSIKLFSPMCLIHGCLQPKRLMSGLCCKPPMPAIIFFTRSRCPAGKAGTAGAEGSGPEEPMRPSMDFFCFLVFLI